MGFLGRSKAPAVDPALASVQQDAEKAHHQPTVSTDKYDSDATSDTLSLEARNEREIEQHPDQVTSDAQLGIQKAEAVALVWPKKATYVTYAWYEPAIAFTSLSMSMSFHLHSPQDMALLLHACFPVCHPEFCICRGFLRLQPGAGVQYCHDSRQHHWRRPQAAHCEDA